MAAEPEPVRLLVIECLDARGEGDARGWCGARRVGVSEGPLAGYDRMESDWAAVFPRAVLEPAYAPDPLPAVSNGWFLVRGHQRGPVFVVDEVLRRAPITAPDGAVLESDWPAGAATFRTRWQPEGQRPTAWHWKADDGR